MAQLSAAAKAYLLRIQAFQGREDAVLVWVRAKKIAGERMVRFHDVVLAEALLMDEKRIYQQ